MRSALPLLLIVSAFGLFYVFINPRYQNTKILQEEASQYEEALAKVEELKVVRDELLTQFNSLPEENVEKLNRIVPDRVNTVKLVADIDSVAGRHGITVSNIMVVEEDANASTGVVEPSLAKPYKVITVSMSFTSNYGNVIPFLSDLEKSLQVVDIKILGFDSSASNSNLYQHELSLETYWMR